MTAPAPLPDDPARRPCRHCGWRAGDYYRGLCRPCWRDRTVRGLYPKGYRTAPLAPGRAVCRHCRSRVVTRPRGLCWSCWYTPDVRALYQPGSANPATAKYVPLCLRPDAPTDADIAAAIAGLRLTRREAGAAG